MSEIADLQESIELIVPEKEPRSPAGKAPRSPAGKAPRSAAEKEQDKILQAKIKRREYARKRYALNKAKKLEEQARKKPKKRAQNADDISSYEEKGDKEEDDDTDDSNFEPQKMAPKKTSTKAAKKSKKSSTDAKEATKKRNRQNSSKSAAKSPKQKSKPKKKDYVKKSRIEDEMKKVLEALAISKSQNDLLSSRISLLEGMQMSHAPTNAEENSRRNDDTHALLTSIDSVIEPLRALQWPKAPHNSPQLLEGNSAELMNMSLESLTTEVIEGNVTEDQLDKCIEYTKLKLAQYSELKKHIKRKKYAERKNALPFLVKTEDNQITLQDDPEK